MKANSKSGMTWQQLVTVAQRFLFGIGLAALALFANGCAFTKDYVALNYTAQTNAVKLEGASDVKLKVEVADTRSVKDKVSVKKNGYGMEMAAIIATNDVVQVLHRAIESELENRGFNVSGGTVIASAELSKFYSDFKTGFWSGNAAAELVMNVQVKPADGTILFSKLVTGEGMKEKVQIFSGQNAKLALDAAMRDAIAKLFSDPAFTDALFKAAKLEKQ